MKTDPHLTRVKRINADGAGDLNTIEPERGRHLNMSEVELHAAISDHDLLLGMKKDHIEILVAGARGERFATDEVIFTEGEPADGLYLIRSGKVVLEAHQPADGVATVQTLQRGQAMGWSWLFPPFVWHLQARALEPTEVVILDGGHLLVASEDNHEFGYELMKRVIRVVIERFQSLRCDLINSENRVAGQVSRDIEI